MTVLITCNIIKSGLTRSYASKMSVRNWLPNGLNSTEQSPGTSNLE